VDKDGSKRWEEGQPARQDVDPEAAAAEATTKTDPQEQTAGMGRDSINRLLLRFSLPATFAMIVTNSYNIIDTIFLGRLGSEAIAALSVSFPIQVIIAALANSTGIGAASLISRSLGAKRYEDASIAAGQIFFLALFLGLAVTILGIIFLRRLLLLFGATPAIMDLTVQYMTIVLAGTVFLMIMLMLTNAARSEGNALVSMRTLVISAVANIIMDPIFIFALGMGVRGAAVATVLSKVLGTGLVLHFYLSRQSALSLRWSHLKPCLQVILEIYRVGAPTIFSLIAGNFSVVLVNRYLGSFGHIPLAVMGLIIRLQTFAFIPVAGISQGLLPIIGFNFGAKKLLRIREALLKGILAGTVFTTAAGAIFFTCPHFFLRLFNSEPELLAIGTRALRIMVVMYPLSAPAVIAVSFFQAVGKGIPTMILSLLRQFLIYLPCIIILPRFFGLTGIWLSTPLSDVLSVIIVTIFFAAEMRRQNIPLFRIQI